MRQRDNNKRDNNNIIIQITLFDKQGKYKPISTLVNVESIEWFRENKEKVKREGLQKICNQKMLSGKELMGLGYTRVKMRNYSLWKEIQEGRKKK